MNLSAIEVEKEQNISILVYIISCKISEPTLTQTLQSIRYPPVSGRFKVKPMAGGTMISLSPSCLASVPSGRGDGYGDIEEAEGGSSEKVEEDRCGGGDVKRNGQKEEEEPTVR